jgi:hypothetical protein
MNDFQELQVSYGKKRIDCSKEKYSCDEQYSTDFLITNLPCCESSLNRELQRHFGLDLPCTKMEGPFL